MKMPKIWEILRKFKAFCKFHGWKTSESYDWVEINDKYHNFLWTRNVHPSSFKSIVTNRKCVVREGSSYHIAEASYTAWLFSKTPSETLVKTIFEDPDFPKTIALYDLSPLVKGKKSCNKLNHTDSAVFQEFENFLKNELKIELRPISDLKLDSENYTIAKFA